MASLDIYYINLASATERRDRFLQSFSASNFSPGWRLTRFEAISGQSEQVARLPGSMPPNQKGAYLSHLECVRLSRDSDRHVMVAEDDTEFCHDTEMWVDSVIHQIPESAWDVIMMDFYVPNAVDMPKVLKLRRRCQTNNSVKLFNAAFWPHSFAGAGSYIVNRRAKDKFLNAMHVDSLICPYDLLLREVMRQQTIIGVLTIPFLTTVSETGDFSQHPTGHDHAMGSLLHMFRRLVWIGAKDPGSLRREAGKINADGIAEDVATLGAIMTPLLAMQMDWDI